MAPQHDYWYVLVVLSWSWLLWDRSVARWQPSIVPTPSQSMLSAEPGIWFLWFVLYHRASPCEYWLISMPFAFRSWHTEQHTGEHGSRASTCQGSSSITNNVRKVDSESQVILILLSVSNCHLKIFLGHFSLSRLSAYLKDTTTDSGMTSKARIVLSGKINSSTLKPVGSWQWMLPLRKLLFIQPQWAQLIIRNLRIVVCFVQMLTACNSAVYNSFVISAFFLACGCYVSALCCIARKGIFMAPEWRRRWRMVCVFLPSFIC